MRVIDCYYIKGSGKESTCTKIHGVGIAYNVVKSAVYVKAVTAIATAISIPPIGLMLGIGVAQGFASASVSAIKSSGLMNL